MSVKDDPVFGRVFVLKDVRVFDGVRFTERGSIVINGDKIGGNPKGISETIDCKGYFLIPGLIDAYVHLHHEGHLYSLAKHRVTTALDMAMWPAEKMNALREKPGLPDIRSAGLPVTVSGSVYSCMLPLPEEALLSGPEQAGHFV